jgi:hypothetical protein
LYSVLNPHRLPSPQADAFYRLQESLTGFTVFYVSSAVVFLLIGMGIMMAGASNSRAQEGEQPPPAGRPPG